MAEVVEARILVSGRVQGVAFRAYTEREAGRLGVDGWVRNLGDGRVEISVSGARDSVESLLDWCRKGSPFAAVKEVQVRWVDVPGEDSAGAGFHVRY